MWIFGCKDPGRYGIADRSICNLLSGYRARRHGVQARLVFHRGRGSTLMNAPVALFTYKRLEHTKATVDALGRNTLAAQTDLHIFSDGAKGEVDSAAVQAVRNL